MTHAPKPNDESEQGRISATEHAQNLSRLRDVVVAEAVVEATIRKQFETKRPNFTEAELDAMRICERRTVVAVDSYLAALEG